MFDALEAVLRYDEVKLALPAAAVALTLQLFAGRKPLGLVITVGIATAASVLAGGSIWIAAAITLGALGGFARSTMYTGGLSVLAGLILVLTEIPVRSDFVLLCASSTAVLTWCLTRFRDLHPEWTNACVFISCAGLFLAVPNADLAGGLLVASSVLFASGRSQPSRWGVVAFAPLFVYTAMRGGLSQTGSIVGGLGTIGFIAIHPIAIAAELPTRWVHARAELDPRVLLVGHALVVVLAARIAAFRRPAEEALLVLGLILVVGLIMVSDGFASLGTKQSDAR